MKTINLSGNFLFATTTFLIALSFIFIQPTYIEAAVVCTFDRNIESGMNGEDIRCLQKYLNDAGFVIAQSGPGSKGNETSLFRDATKSALIKWQEANNLSPAIGFFGPLSRAKYSDLVNGNSNGQVLGESTTSDNESQVTDLLDKLNILQAQLDVAKTEQNTVQDEDVKSVVLKAVEQIESSEAQIERALGDGESIGHADDNIIDAREDFYEAVVALLNNNMERALSFAQSAYDNAADAYEDAGGETEEDEIDEFIDEVEDEISDAWDEIEIAKDNGKNIDKAEEILEDAEDLIDQAKENLKEDDFDEARDLAEEAEDLIDDALDSVSDNDQRDAEGAIDDASDAINDAWDDVRDADRDGQDVDDAEDLLGEAEDALDDAQDAYDDGDYDEAVDKAEEAEDLARDALNEI